MNNAINLAERFTTQILRKMGQTIKLHKHWRKHNNEPIKQDRQNRSNKLE